ncbi:Sterol 3-beta-glucosyltransferase [Sphaceloma murrayae]|uniref:Sterol 3-beta-glucosyltransferase n=1 Tax=Sphaceloma murrayae TaxID=2082308 RepID=A0A2K1QVK6_9PEZI|nr:Sterol 3-beta-glucosyltransferase [Sphaceloma murrayae]
MDSSKEHADMPLSTQSVIDRPNPTGSSTSTATSTYGDTMNVVSPQSEYEMAPETYQEQGPEYFDQAHKGNLLDPTTGRRDYASPEPREMVASREGLPEPGPNLQRAGTEPAGNMRPSIDRSHKTEGSAPRKSMTSPDEFAWRKSNDHRSRKGLRFTRAPFSYHYDDSSDTSISSSSEDEDDGENISKIAKSPSHLAGISAEDKRKRRQLQRERSYHRIALGNDQYQTKGKLSKRDGRLRISISDNVNSGRIAKWLGKSIRNHLDIAHKGFERQAKAKDASADFADEEVQRIAEGMRDIPKPHLKIVIMVIGSRGDIQPFLKLGQILRDRGHRVRIATHPAFRDFVQNDIGLEFFDIGGDPSELMAFMVKNPGLIPSFETVRQGEIARRRTAMAEMFEGFWRSCINATDNAKDRQNHQMMGDKSPFVADAIIANPPSFAHVHIAERLGVPLHMMFTFPYSPTTQFPHPLANIKSTKSNVDAGYVNFMSYALVEMMTWQGLGDLVNSFRVRTLGLEPISSFWAPDALWRMKVPYTYMWSPELVPKPKDWGPEIDVTGFVFLDLASNFKPPPELQKFLDAGEKPVYIGFGSIVVDDPDNFTKLIFEAVKKAGVRALVSKGWGGFGGKGNAPDGVFMLENTPHDWLFPRCSAVVHHGGAGTTAIGLKCGMPTVIVPFFGDQPFWGAMVADNKAGAHRSIPYKKLTAERLAEGIKQCMTEEARENAQRIAKGIEEEGDGAENAVRSFERSLPLAGHHNMRCSILEERVAVWKLKHSNLRLSTLAAELLIEERKIKWNQLNLLRHYEYNDFDGPGEPISGMGGAVMRSAHGVGKGLGMIPYRMEEHVRRRKEYMRRRRKSQKKTEAKKAKKEAEAQSEAEKRGDIAPVEVKAGETPRRPEGVQHQSTTSMSASQLSNQPKQSLAHELAEDAGMGVRRALASLFWAPLDAHMAVAQGFHNAPRLYGDSTVRKPLRINGIKSGMRAARNEFCFGIYDGVTGIVTQPFNGVKYADGAAAKFANFWTGFGKGIGGAALKPTSAFISTPAFFGQGLRKEIRRRTRGPVARGNAWVRKAHIIQGQKDIKAIKDLDDGEKKLEEAQKRVDDGWKTMNEVWAVAAQYKKAGGKVMGAWRVKREQKKWERTGALENVSATERALESAKNRKDLQRFFKQREKEMEVADQPQTFEELKARDPVTKDAQDRPDAHGKDSDWIDVDVGNDTDSTKVESPNVRQTNGGKVHQGKVDVSVNQKGPAGVIKTAGRPVAASG